jgi:hypothetical protein
MKQIIFLFILAVFAISVAQAQTIPNTSKTKVTKTKLEAPSESKMIKPEPTEPKAPPPAPPPPAINKTPATTSQNVPVYNLTSVRVTIRTGNDNKEFPSKVMAWIQTKNPPSSEWFSYKQINLANEMRINSNTEFGLERDSLLRGVIRLEDLQAKGIQLKIWYASNWLTDAWKIESVSVVLEFKDQNGNLHPTLGNKTIVFSNAYGFLNNDYKMMVCTADGSFAPLTAVITK